MKTFRINMKSLRVHCAVGYLTGRISITVLLESDVEFQIYQTMVVSSTMRCYALTDMEYGNDTNMKL